VEHFPFIPRVRKYTKELLKEIGPPSAHGRNKMANSGVGKNRYAFNLPADLRPVKAAAPATKK